MRTFVDNAKFDFLSPLEKQKMQFQNDVKMGKQPNPTGPIQPRVTQQWKKNVYTSQPNSKKYDMIRKNIDTTQRKDDDFWKLFDLNDAENVMTQNQHGPIKDKGYDEDEFDEFDENDYINNNRR